MKPQPHCIAKKRLYQRHRGFTLIELLVGMSLLAVIMTGLVAAMRTMAQTEVKIDQRLQRLDEIRGARSFMQQILSRVSTELTDAPGATGKTVASFVATPSTLTWVGIMPARPGAGGRYYFRLAMEGVDDNRALVLRFFPWNSDHAYPDWSSAEPRTLAPDVKQLTIQAQGLSPNGASAQPPWPQGWQAGWPVPNALPDRIRIGVIDAQGNWPEWNIALQSLPQSDGSFSTQTFGPTK